MLCPSQHKPPVLWDTVGENAFEATKHTGAHPLHHGLDVTESFLPGSLARSEMRLSSVVPTWRTIHTWQVPA